MPRDRRMIPGSLPDEVVATVALLRSEVVAPERLAAVLEQVGSAVEVLENSSGIPGETQLSLQAVSREAIEAAASEVAGWQAEGLDARTVLDPRYPANLFAVFNKPPLLFVAGTWEEPRDRRAVAVVGTRGASETGLRKAARLAQALAEAGITVVSGLARGVDAAAHIAALRAQGRTVAVMGTGIRRIYPADNRPIAEGILRAGGALLSQFYPDQPPTKWTFPKRNVTMSGLSVATVVIEAGASSGAKMQAEAALTHGRSVFLPSSLVGEHAWARKMVEEGFRGTLAIEISSPEDLVERLDFPLDAPGEVLV